LAEQSPIKMKCLIVSVSVAALCIGCDAKKTQLPPVGRVVQVPQIRWTDAARQPEGLPTFTVASREQVAFTGEL
jgi:hypothetical protein